MRFMGMTWFRCNERGTCIDPPGGAHKLAAVRKACEEAKRRLQSSKNDLKRRQDEVGTKMKKYKQLLRQLETEYNDTIKEMRKHKEEQVNESCLSLHRLCCNYRLIRFIMDMRQLRCVQ